MDALSNALLICGLVALALLAIVFYIGLAKFKAGVCLACFILVIVLACGLLYVATQPPKIESWTVTYVSGNMVTMYSGNGGSMTTDITKIPHISYDYSAGTAVQMMRNVLGAPIFLSPQDYTVLPTK